MIYPRSIVVPTDDAIVSKYLRDLNEPMCFFGEGPAERRERLGRALAKLSPEERSKLDALETVKPSVEDDGQDQIFYYEGSEDLMRARCNIADYSIRQCNYRLDMARIKQLEPMSTRLIPQQDLIERVRQSEDLGSYVDEDNSTTELKTLTSCNFNPSTSLLATSARSGRCKIWSIPDMETHSTLKGHQSNANFITFSPDGTNLASCAMDGSVLMWNLSDSDEEQQQQHHQHLHNHHDYNHQPTTREPVCQLSGRQSWRVTRVRYHPCGLYLASCCSDKSWRLWDLTTQTEILHQEGHSDAVFDLAYHPDGSLVGSAGLDSYGRVWDLRTGRSVQLLEGHTKGIRTIDFSPDGYHIATGSMDNSVKVWNLRQRKLEYTIPAHVNTVTTVMFERENGYYLATSSFDKSIKFWSSQTWAPIKTLDAYDDKISKFDISFKSTHLASCHFKYIKLWKISDTIL